MIIHLVGWQGFGSRNTKPDKDKMKLQEVEGTLRELESLERQSAFSMFDSSRIEGKASTEKRTKYDGVKENPLLTLEKHLSKRKYHEGMR